MTASVTQGTITTKIHLQRNMNNVFTGLSNKLMVIFKSDDGQLYVLDRQTGRLILDEKTSPIPTFENPDTMCDPKTEPC